MTDREEVWGGVGSWIGSDRIGCAVMGWDGMGSDRIGSDRIGWDGMGMGWGWEVR